MRKKADKIKIAGLLTLAIICFGFNFSELVTAQSGGRQRVVEKPTPTSKVTPKPKITPTPKFTPTPTPTVTPTPSPTPTPTPTPVPIQTVTDLQSRIRLSLVRPELRRGQIGEKSCRLTRAKRFLRRTAKSILCPLQI